MEGGLFSAVFWRSFWRDVRRFNKDTRARARVIVHILFLLFSITYCYVILHTLHDPFTDIALTVVLFLILTVGFSVRFAQRREAERISKADIATAPRELTTRLQGMAHSLNAVIGRALGELWLRRNKIPDEDTVISRSRQLDDLRQRGLWESLPQEVRNWMMQPDGAWTDEQVANALSQAETLHTLLWSLALITELRPLEQLAEPISIPNTVKALEHPAPGVRPTWDLRIARNRAQEFFVRCYAENVDRGHHAPTVAEQEAAIRTWMADIDSGSVEDRMTGAQTIRETESETLDIITRSSARRIQALSLVMDLLDGLDHWSQLTTLLYTGIVPPPTEGEREAPTEE